ncbi:MAG: hypothetical protein M3126_11760, partial [Candidatus Eremiobacteraeota bacterium]|nr:hypothetical protein [Candidatus Eremiobacteraeota bacterium]
MRELDAFSITDHDTIAAYPVPKDLRDRVINGLEVDSQFEGDTVHLLAYGIGNNYSPLMCALRTQREARYLRMAAMVGRLNALGIPIQLDEVLARAGGGSIGRPHLARALVAKGYVSDTQEAFNRYIADDGDGYVALARLSTAEIIDLIHRSGGVAVVAHPKRLPSSVHLSDVCDLGAD